MRNKLTSIILTLILSVFTVFAINNFTKGIYADEITLTVNLKAYNNAGLRLFYNNEANKYVLDKSEVQLIFASQFYKKITFNIPDVKYTRFLRFDMGDVKNEFFISDIEMSVNNVSHSNTIGKWTGLEINQIIGGYNDAGLQSGNANYIQLAGGIKDPYFLFNDVIHNKIQQHYKDNGYVNADQVAASLFLSLFIIIVMIYFIPRIQFGAFPAFVKNGGVLTGAGAFIVFFIFINNKFHFVGDRGSQENRTLAAQPELTLRNFFTYPDQFSNYARDNFSFRNDLFFLHSRYMTSIFKESPMPNDALLGKNGWFFDNEQGCINDYRRITKISREELSQISKSMYEKKKWLDDRGIKFYIIIPPNKHSVYPENLPPGFFETVGIGENRLKVYKQHLEKYNGISLVDPTDALMAAKKKHDVYYTTDTHWNLYGGFIGYTELMKQICKDFPQLKPVTENDFHFTTFYSNEGDLARVVGLNDVYKREEVSLTLKDTTVKLTMPNSSEILIDYDHNKTVDGSKLKLLMLRDSYSNYLIPFINLHFEKAKYLWSYDFPDKIIEQEKPDVVIFESLQRFMSGAFAIPNPESLDTTVKR